MGSEPDNSGRIRVLIVDANPDGREYLEAYLDQDAYEVVATGNGEEALRLAASFRPDVILLELLLPDMDGVDLCLALRGDEELARSVVIVLAEQEMEDKLRMAMEAGADDYLFRPFRASELALRIRARLRHRHSSWRPEEQEALLDLTRMLASSLDMRDLLHLVAVRTAEVLQVDRCSFVLIYPEGAKAKVVAASESAALGGIEVSLENYPEIREVIRTQRPFVVDRVEDHPTLKGILPMLIRKGVGSLALFPMIHEGRVDGVLFLRSERFRHVLGERDIFFASAVAAAVALSLRNLQAVERERQVANELQRTKQFMENLIDSSVDAIVAADMMGNIILFNKGAERIFGYRADEVVGKLHVTKLYPSGVAYEVMDSLRSDANGGKGYLDTTRKEVINKSGELVPIHLTSWIVMENGNEVATAGIFTDLRERLRIERKLSQAQEKLVRTEKQAMIAELAGATAHELNQPLTSVLGYTELAKRKLDKTETEEVGRILDIILSETERMADIVKKVGRITRYETKSYVGEQRIVDIDRSSKSD